MGGMAEGQRIACQTTACLLNAFPFPEPAVTSVPKLISACTQTIYQQFTATAAAPCRCLDFGKSTALLERRRQRPFLLREHQLYALNTRQEFQKGPAAVPFTVHFPIEEAFSDPQAGALSQYIGKEGGHAGPHPHSTFPFFRAIPCCYAPTESAIHWTLKQIREAMELPVQDSAARSKQQSKPHFPHRITIPQSFYIITGKGEY